MGFDAAWAATAGFADVLARIFHTLSSLRNGCLQATNEYAGAGNLTGVKLWVSWAGQAVRFPG